MPAMKTPGVYIVEKNAFPNSVVEVATAVPAFIGYTEKAENGDKSLIKQPWRISSLAEYETYYGGGPKRKFNIVEEPKIDLADFKVRGAIEELPDEGYKLDESTAKFLLYYSMKLFFQNGGGPCYIVSIGSYDETTKGDGNGKIDMDQLMSGIAPLAKEQEPTMVVIPEAIGLPDIDKCTSVQEAMLLHCGGKMRNRVAILDVFNGYKDLQDFEGTGNEGDAIGNCVTRFRSKIGINNLDFATAYYPWVNTTIVQDTHMSFDYLNTAGKTKIIEMLNKELKVDKEDDLPKKDGELTEEGKALKEQRTLYGTQIKEIVDFKVAFDAVKNDDKHAGKTDKEIKAVVMSNRTLLNKTLTTISPLYVQVLKTIAQKLNVLPPSAAMAGVYTAVDNSRGVWKAPANVSLAAVSGPTVAVTHEEQENLNVDTKGKSINAIRSFIGEGTLVWGARTLDGNSLDWRYISVRRTMIMMEESIRLGTKAYVFEPNNAQTWVTIKSMIRNFLTSVWKRGGLAGASPDDAFSVHVGLGETMTPEDILEGILRVSVLVAVTRPAEFIEITFTQQMQKS